MKRILALAFLVAMLALPSVLASPVDNPNGTPAAIGSYIVVYLWGEPDLPGFSEVGIAIAGEAGEGNRGLAALAPPHNEPS